MSQLSSGHNLTYTIFLTKNIPLMGYFLKLPREKSQWTSVATRQWEHLQTALSVTSQSCLTTPTTTSRHELTTPTTMTSQVILTTSILIWRHSLTSVSTLTAALATPMGRSLWDTRATVGCRYLLDDRLAPHLNFWAGSKNKLHRSIDLHSTDPISRRELVSRTVTEFTVISCWLVDGVKVNIDLATVWKLHIM